MELFVHAVEATRLVYQRFGEFRRGIAGFHLEVTEGGVGLGDNVVGDVNVDKHVKTYEYVDKLTSL